MKTSELIGPALDWAVAKSMGFNMHTGALLGGFIREGTWLQGYYIHNENAWLPLRLYKPSSEWDKGGPIIERKKIKISPNLNDTWSAQIRHETSHPLVAHKVLAGWTNSSGPTILVAAMRCLVRSKLGDEIELPEKLL